MNLLLLQDALRKQIYPLSWSDMYLTQLTISHLFVFSIMSTATGITTRIWHWKSHWKVQPHWKTAETSLNSFTYDNHTEIRSLITLKYFCYCYPRLLTPYKPTENFQVCSNPLFVQFSALLCFSVWFSVSYSGSKLPIKCSVSNVWIRITINYFSTKIGNRLLKYQGLSKRFGYPARFKELYLNKYNYWWCIVWWKMSTQYK